MPLWMQLLMNGGLLRQEANGEGSDLGGGSGGEGGEGDEKKEPTEPTKKTQKPTMKVKNKPTDKEAELLKKVTKKKPKLKK
ncbi:hypothetical protein ABVN80_14655 [Acinetobacter baumannii]